MKTGLQIEPEISAFASEAAEEMLSHARLRREIALLRRRNDTLEGLFDRLSLGVALVDSDGRLHYRNRAARTMFARCDGLVERNGLLTAHDATATRALLRLIIAAAVGAPEGETLTLPSEKDGQSYALLATRQLAPLNAPVLDDWMASGRPPTPARLNGGDLILLLIRDPHQSADGNFAAVRQHFALTICESKLLEALTFGERLNDFCRRRGISPNTGKFHLRSLFAKTGTHRQADLIRRTIALLASFAPFGV